jgi:hypothetical protein
MPSLRDLLLVTGILGTGKTWYGDKFAEECGFLHYDLEDQQTLNRLAADPAKFIADILGQKKDVVVTWGFAPDDQPSVAAVLQFRNSGFKLVWFDGNRPAALRAFIKRRTVDEVCFYVQMYKIESSNVVELIKPIIINPFDGRERFKPTAELLEEIRRA